MSKRFDIEVRVYDNPVGWQWRIVQARMQERGGTADFACTCCDIFGKEPIGECFDVLKDKMRELLKGENHA